MTLEQRDLVWIRVERERRLIDRRGPRVVAGWRKCWAFPDSIRHAFGIAVDETGGQLAIAERRREEDVWRRSTSEEEARHVWCFPDRPLGRRRLVILVARVDARAM